MKPLFFFNVLLKEFHVVNIVFLIRLTAFKIRKTSGEILLRPWRLTFPITNPETK